MLQNIVVALIHQFPLVHIVIKFNLTKTLIKEYETFSGPPYFKFINGFIFEIGQYCQDRFICPRK